MVSILDEVASQMGGIGAAIGMTLLLFVLSAVFGTILGVIVGIGRTARFRVVRWVCATYTNLLRGIPVLITLLFVYFGLPILMPGWLFSQLMCGVIGLSLFVGAYVAEIIRGSIAAIPQGQNEAADALAMSSVQKLTVVILPQALRIALPAWTGSMLALVKETSLVSVLGLVELTKAARLLGTSTGEPLILFLLAAAVYFVLCFPLGRFGTWYERKLARTTGQRAVEAPTTTDIVNDQELTPQGGRVA